MALQMEFEGRSESFTRLWPQIEDKTGEVFCIFRSFNQVVKRNFYILAEDQQNSSPIGQIWDDVANCCGIQDLFQSCNA